MTATRIYVGKPVEGKPEFIEYVIEGEKFYHEGQARGLKAVGDIRREVRIQGAKELYVLPFECLSRETTFPGYARSLPEVQFKELTSLILGELEPIAKKISNLDLAA